MKTTTTLGIVALVLSLSTTAEAVPITLFNTGADGSGSLLAAGDLDPHWTITTSAEGSFSTPAPAITQLNHPAWLANGPNSNWISVVAAGTTPAAEGAYVYETTFDLTGLAPSSAQITGQFSVDNNVTDVLLNGASTGINGGGFSVFIPFTINSGFIAGVNTLAFEVLNAGASANPHGLRVELSGTALVPEPSTLSLVAGIGLVGLFGFQRRRHTAK